MAGEEQNENPVPWFGGGYEIYREPKREEVDGNIDGRVMRFTHEGIGYRYTLTLQERMLYKIGLLTISSLYHRVCKTLPSSAK